MRLLIPVLLLVAPWAWSQNIDISASARVETMPDRATLSAVLVATQPDAASACQLVREQSAKVVKLVRELGIARRDVMATPLSFGPDYDWKGETKVYKGVTARREVTIRLRDLTKYPELVNGLVAVPVTGLGKVRLGSSQFATLAPQALAKAIADAQAKAQVVAEQLAVQVGDTHSITSISVIDPENPPQLPRREHNAGETFEPGTINIFASIGVEFAVKPKR